MFPFPHPDRPLVKICGVTSPENAADVVAAGADAVGINLYPRSKRFAAFDDVARWLPGVPGPAAKVAVFVNAESDDIRRAAESGMFQAIQLHGDESPEFCQEVRRFGLPVIRAVSVCREDDLERLSDWPADALLLDAFAPGEYGGTGRVCNWTLAARAVAAAGVPVHLSGGISPGNVEEAVSTVRPAGIDVAGGVESAPGIKDPAKVRALVAAARNARP